MENMFTTVKPAHGFSIGKDRSGQQLNIWNTQGGFNMKLTGNLKKQVEATATKDEAREAIRNAGMILDDEELDQVTGGGITVPLVSPYSTTPTDDAGE